MAIDKVRRRGHRPSCAEHAVPVSFRGRVIQQIGRVTRGEGHADAPPTVHDFRDTAVPLLERMHQRRRRVMKKEGFAVAE
ncbi:hypothetical protein [Microbacterium sp. 18062]|uniref:hypothetical protein n=1 Tax=Microbacterium sp. 18062 TaxID=2681410 RepID=UPI00135B5A8C|nr:hypothetical protein [Microbacterium sp. 18062]